MRSGVTLVELLVVLSIITVLSALTVGAGKLVQDKAKRSRTILEIAALDTALERYKMDNGDYPDVGDSGLSLIRGNLYNHSPSSYIGSAATIVARSGNKQGSVSGGGGGKRLFACLMGRQNFMDVTTVAYPQYLELKARQIGTDVDGASYFQDSYGRAYGYYYDASGQSGVNHQQYSLFNLVRPDIWSTAGQAETAVPSLDLADKSGYAVYLRWIKNWATP